MSLPASDLNKKADGLTTMQLGDVLPETAEVIDGHLHIGGVDMVNLAKDQGTALYVYDEQELRHNMERYLSAFRKNYPNSDVLYASKAFLNMAILNIANELGMCLDVSGGGELAMALAAKFPAERIFVHGNNKTPLELEEAISAGAGRIVVDSLEELGRISEIAGKLGKTQDIYMRITPGVEADTHAYICTGCEDSKFGFTLRDDYAFACIKQAIDTPNVNLAGLHCHIGSQIFALESFKEAAFVMVNMIARVRDEFGYTIKELDLGGGLGVAYMQPDRPSTIEDFAKVTCDAVREACEKHGLELPRLMVEPGRSLVANAGVTLYTVGTIKDLKGVRKFVAIDGGMSDNIRTALYDSEYEPVIANKADRPRTEIVTLCGKHCESGDAVVLDGSLQEAEVEDIVCVFGTGAYCYTMASNYNGQPRPGIVFVKDGKANLVTRRETYADLMSRDIVYAMDQFRDKFQKNIC